MGFPGGKGEAHRVGFPGDLRVMGFPGDLSHGFDS